jgi:hypothetical protein
VIHESNNPPSRMITCSFMVDRTKYNKCWSWNQGGSAPAPGAVFRALAENPCVRQAHKRSCRPRARHSRTRGAFRNLRPGALPIPFPSISCSSVVELNWSGPGLSKQQKTAAGSSGGG